MLEVTSYYFMKKQNTQRSASDKICHAEMHQGRGIYLGDGANSSPYNN
ncbi:hypothetical protein X975_13151, partial [Stegodyphus mimosarum]